MRKSAKVVYHREQRPLAFLLEKSLQIFTTHDARKVHKTVYTKNA